MQAYYSLQSSLPSQYTNFIKLPIHHNTRKVILCNYFNHYCRYHRIQLLSSWSSPDETSTLQRNRIFKQQQQANTITIDKPYFHFEILHQSTKPQSRARLGRLHTPHGIVDTPSFVPVATNGVLKGVSFTTLDNHPHHTPKNIPSIQHCEEESLNPTARGQLVFCNTYHLLVHPGREVIKNAGGIHQFTNRHSGPFITDSGGFQIFSFGSHDHYLHNNNNDSENTNTPKTELKRTNAQKQFKLKKGWRDDIQQKPNNISISEQNGATIKNYRNGESIQLTPESTIQAQKDFGADIIIPLDELPSHYIHPQQLEKSVLKSHLWEKRSLDEHLKNVRNQAIYCVIHGGTDHKLRQMSIDYLSSLPFDGYAIGGSLGSTRSEMVELLQFMMPLLDNDIIDDINIDYSSIYVQQKKRRNKPRHLLGIGDEESIRNVIPLGIDTMDSCYPTRLGRHGTLLTRHEGLLRIKKGQNAIQYGRKIDDDCNCLTCTRYDRAYLNHLFKAKESLAVMLATQHNLYYMQDLMANIRSDIQENKI